MDGQQLTKSLYATPRAELFQIRDLSGRKVAEFTSAEEARNYLNDRTVTGLDVWLLDGFPGKVVAIKPAKEFIENNKP